LMHKLISTLRAQGTQRVIATVLTENKRMLELARLLGFEFAPAVLGSDTREIAMKL